MQLKTLIFMVLLLAGIAFPVAIGACGALGAGVTYELTNNILNYSGASCFTSVGPNTVFNGQGFLVDGTGQAGGTGAFQDGGGGFTLLNVRISDFSRGFTGTGNMLMTQNVSGSNVTDSYYITDTTQTITIINNTFWNTSNGVVIASTLAMSGLNIYNSTFNASNSSLIIRKTDAYIVNSSFNATCFNYLPAGNIATYYNDSFTDWRFVTVASNMTFDTVVSDIANTSSILLKAYNHETFARINYANYTIINSTTNFLYDKYWIMLDYRYGANTSISVSENANYYPSYLIADASWENGFGDQILLIPKTASNVATVTFHLIDNMNTPISGATCGVFKAGPTSWMLLGAKKTDTTGVIAMIMQTTTQYKLLCSASGYSTYTTYLTPASSDYTVTLSSAYSGIGFPTSIEGIRTSFNQTVLNGMAWNVTQTLNFTIANTSANSSLDWFAWRVYNGTTLLNSQNDSTHPSGYSLVYTFMPGNNSNITVNIIFKRLDRGIVEYTFYIPTYYGYSSSGGASLTDALAGLGSLGLLTIVLLTLIVGALVGGYVSQISAGAGVVAFMGILSMGFFILMSASLPAWALGWFGGIMILSFVVAGGYFVLRGGG